jgi:hypothetical protein
MSASNEWFDYHLTPRGWELGSSKTDFGRPVTKDPPSDRVISIHVTERLSSSFSKVDQTTTVTFQTDDTEALNDLIARFGESP